MTVLKFSLVRCPPTRSLMAMIFLFVSLSYAARNSRSAITHDVCHPLLEGLRNSDRRPKVFVDELPIPVVKERNRRSHIWGDLKILLLFERPCLRCIELTPEEFVDNCTRIRGRIRSGVIPTIGIRGDSRFRGSVGKRRAAANRHVVVYFQRNVHQLQR